MDPKPRWLTCTPSNAAVSSSSPVSSSSSSNQLFYRERLPGFDRHTRGPPLKLDSDSQSPRFHDPPKNYSTPEGCHSGWKLSPASASRDSAWADSSGGGRSKQFYHQRSSEIQLGAYPGLLGSEQDVDSRRSLMANTSRSLCSGSLHSFPEGSRHSSAGSISDSPWQVRSSPSRASGTSSSSEGLWSRREPSGSGVHSAGILGSRTTDQDNVTSCYAQGARPKEGVSTNRGSDSYLHRLPSEYQPSWLSGDSRGDASTAAGEPPVGSSDPGARRRPSWSDNWPANLSERPPSSSVLCRSHGRTGDLTERHGARPLLSRLASSMSSTLFSRRSSQDPGSSGSSSSPPEAGSSLQRGGLATPDDSSSGLPFLRRRRQGSPPVPWSSSVESDLETPRASSSWLSSSFRSRCAPLFPRRRREGRDETVLAMSATAFERSRCPPVTTQGLESDATEEEEPQGAGAASHHSAHGPPQAGIDQELSGITNSLLQLAMPSTLEGTGGSTMPTVNLRAIGRTPSDEQGEENPTSSRDPERVKMIQESLLLEESDEEEGDLCRICQMGHNAPSDPLIEPCRCTGSLQYVHQECMKRWLLAKISSGSSLEAISTCELCREKLQLDIEDFDLNELHRTHERSEYEFISCGLYLVVLLHLCEQRFSETLGIANDIGFFNLARTLREHMDNLERAYRESEEEEAQHNRPSVDVCDSEDEEDHH